MARRTRIKICGITNPEDAAAAVDSGVDALGLVFYEPSPRFLQIDRAARLAAQIPAFVDVVALFVDPQPALVEAVIKTVQPDLLQFHGNETAAFCAAFGRAHIKAGRVREDEDIEALVGNYPLARGFLLDSYQPGIPGGTGTTFNWKLIHSSMGKRIILAGGLNPDNVGEAIAAVKPYAVDVSGGVEREKGVKDAGKISRFVQAVRDADRKLAE